MSHPNSVTLRPYQPTDAVAVIDLINAEAQATVGFQRAVLDHDQNPRLTRYLPTSSERVVAVNDYGIVGGFAYLADRDQHLVYELGGAVHPNCWNQGIGSQLRQWAEQRAQALSTHAPAGVKTVLQANLFPAEVRAQRLLTRAGFAPVREWLHLEIELDAPPAHPSIPLGLTLRAIDLDNDWDDLGPAMDEAFADHWGAIVLPTAAPTQEEPTIDPEIEIPQDDPYSNAPGFCFALWEGDTIAGGILCNAKLVERTDTGRVGSVCVRPRYRRQKVGQTLMLTAFRAFWEAGLRRIILDTDAQSFTQSFKFYNSLGMCEYRRETLYEKEIRPGREVRRLADE